LPNPSAPAVKSRAFQHIVQVFDARPFGAPPFVTSSKPTIPLHAFSSRLAFAEALPFRFLRIFNTKPCKPLDEPPWALNTDADSCHIIRISSAEQRRFAKKPHFP
jgi:hypothetical protein